MLPILLEFINRCASEEADPERVAELLEEEPHLKDSYHRMILRMRSHSIDSMGGPLFDMPILTQQQCEYLVSCAKWYDFTPNTEEGDEYRIEEAIIEDVDPELYEHLKKVLLPILNAYCLIINSTPITRVVSFQFAKYRPEGTPGTGWHHDKESDFSTVISLDPDSFTGGGTGVRMAPHLSRRAPPLSRGHGLMFNGRCVQHRGLPVTDGERLLLVCWCATN